MRKFTHGTFPLKIPTKEYPNFSDRLKVAMRLRKCSVDELAESCFLTPSAISGYRTGLRSPNIETLRILAMNLDVSSDFLIGLQEEIFI